MFRLFGFISVRCLLGALMLVAHSLVFASPTYLFSPGAYGDTAIPVDINDHGVLVWTGFSISGGASRFSDGSFVSGYGDAFGCDICGVQVTDINDAGDLFGSALKNGVYVPTIWIAGVPHDLTDPANAGLTFHHDPGPKFVTNFDLGALDVLNLPSYVIFGSFYVYLLDSAYCFSKALDLENWAGVIGWALPSRSPMIQNHSIKLIMPSVRK